jgi:hypothetical protein
MVPEQAIAPILAADTAPAVIRQTVEQLRLREVERHRKVLEWLDGVQSMATAVLDTPLPAESRRRRPRFRKLSPLRMVFEAARSFGATEFTSDQLFDRLNALFPAAKLSGDIVSRRLYDLRRRTPAMVSCIDPIGEAGAGADFPMNPKCYRYTGPPLECPATG